MAKDQVPFNGSECLGSTRKALLSAMSRQGFEGACWIVWKENHLENRKRAVAKSALSYRERERERSLYRHSPGWKIEMRKKSLHQTIKLGKLSAVRGERSENVQNFLCSAQQLSFLRLNNLKTFFFWASKFQEKNLSTWSLVIGAKGRARRLVEFWQL